MAKNKHWRIMDPVRSSIRQAMIFSAAASIFAVGSLVVTAYILKDLLIDQSDWGLFALLVFLVLLAWILRAFSFRTSHLAAFTLERILRNQIAERLTHVSLGYLHNQGSPALTKIMQDDVHDLHAFVADSTPLYARSYAAPLASFMALLFIDWKLALIAATVLMIGVILFALMMRGTGELQEQYNSAREQVTTAVVEFVQAMPVVRTFNNGETSFGRYQQALDRYLGVLINWYRQAGFQAQVSMLILNATITLIVLSWCGLYWWQSGTLSFHSWLAVLLVGTGMAEALMPYIALIHLIEKAKLSASRILEVLEAPILPLLEPTQTPKDAHITFENVSFRYPDREEDALRNISFSVPTGSLTALVGGSGAGKTTVARLIPRFWDVSAGCIRIGGVDIRHISPEVLMEHVSFVFQDNFLFSGSIAENIRLGIEHASDEDVIAAAQAAQCHDFITALPDGYQTLVGERGATLSGGERQRITIARAILQNRPILILDEATAFADAENEALIMQALHTLMQGKTVLMIAHRLGTIRHAEQILVFDHGTLIEQGRHETLIAQNGRYADLWQACESARNWRIGTSAQNRYEWQK